MDIDVDKILNKLREDYPIEEEIKFCEFDLQDKLKDNSFKVIRYRDIYDKERAKLEYIEELMDKLIGERYDYYRFDYDKALDKTEIKNYYIPKDEKVLRMKKIIRKQKIKVDFFDMCIKALQTQGWNMKHFWETVKGGL
jgi:hypothetical protein